MLPFLLVILGAIAAAMPAGAAPLPPFQPVDLCGTIRSSTWLPPRGLPPIVGMSGSAGRARDWPGRFVVVLADFSGIDADRAERINGLVATTSDASGVVLEPGELLLVLPEDDRNRLDGAAAICVAGLVIRGDEGGTWTHYEKLEVIAGGKR